MATRRIPKAAESYLYIKEWMEHLDVSDDELARRLGLSSRSSVWKLYKEQHRLDFGKAPRIAAALGIHLSQLFYPPGVESLDAIAKDVSPQDRQKAADILRRMFSPAT